MTIHIEWQRGYMNIDLDKFLPCSKRKFNKLLKVIELDVKDEELKGILKSYIQRKIPEYETMGKINAELYLSYKNKVAVAQQLINKEECVKYGIYPHIKIGDIKQAKKDFKKYNSECRAALRELKKIKKGIKNFNEILSGARW